MLCIPGVWSSSGRWEGMRRRDGDMQEQVDPAPSVGVILLPSLLSNVVLLAIYALGAHWHSQALAFAVSAGLGSGT